MELKDLSRSASKNLPLWIIAGVLGAFLFLCVGCAGIGGLVLFVGEYQRRERLLREEPWRQYYPAEHRYDP